jgi:YbbR domain-containing protein
MSTMARIPLLILSFVLSILLWVYVQVQENPTKQPKTSYTLNVEVRNLPASMEVVKPPDPIRVFPVGKREEIARIDEADLSAYVDLSTAQSGTGTFPVHLVVGGDYDVKWDPPSSARKVAITVERTTTKAIPVRVQISGSLSNPDYMYLPDSTYVEPPTLLIKGPASSVDRVLYARAILDLTNVSPNKTYQSEVELLEDLDRPAQGSVHIAMDDTSPADAKSSAARAPTIVTIHPAIAVGLETRSLHIQPTYRGLPAPGHIVKQIQVTPEDVQVRGRPPTLSSMSVLRTEDVDISGLKETKVFTVTPRLPQDTLVTSPQVITVRVVIERVAAAGSPALPKATEQPARRKGG